MRIGDRSNQGRCNKRTDAGNVIKKLTDFARAVPDKDATIRIEDLMLPHLKLTAQGHETVTRGRRDAVILAILDDLQQPLQPIATDSGDDAELRQMGTQGIDQRRALTDEKVTGPVQHQDRLLIRRLDLDEAHCRPRHGLADGFRIRHVVLLPLHQKGHTLPVFMTR